MMSLRDAMDRLFEESIVRTPEHASPGAGRLPLDLYETETAVIINPTCRAWTPTMSTSPSATTF